MTATGIRCDNNEMTQARFFVDGPVCNECSINPSCLIITALLTTLACPCLWIEVSVAKGGAWGGQDVRVGRFPNNSLNQSSCILCQP